MTLWRITQAVLNGLLSGGVYALIGVGITIIFGVMKMVNFAAGAYLVWGMYFTYLFNVITGLNAYALIPIVIVCMALFGFVTFKLSINKVIKVGGTSFILITVGLSFFLQNLAETIFGTQPLTVPSSLQQASLRVGSIANLPVVLSVPRLIAFGVMLVLVIGVNILLNKTILGRSMRATAEKPEVATMLGINTQRTYTVAFILGVAFAGLSGCIITPMYYVQASVGDIFRTAPLMVVVMGGMGNIKGALVAGLLVGIVEQVISTMISADLGTVGICLLFLIILYIKPYGLFGRGERAA